MGLFLLVTRCLWVLLVVTDVTNVVPKTRPTNVLEFPSAYFTFRVLAFL